MSSLFLLAIRKNAKHWRQSLGVALFAVLLLVSCTADETLRAVGLVEGFLGGVAGDEPRAVIVARDVLSAGGSAADAAVALYFTTAVTYPSSSALGAGGACVVYDPGERKAEALDFSAATPAGVSAGADRVNSVPGAVRGMFALHARYGRLPWSRLLRPAEELARLGHPVSRALARELALVARPLFADPGMAAAFVRGDGTPLAEGDELVQLDLAAVITAIRTRGPGAMYGGDLARKLVEAVTAAGGSLSIDDLRNYRPVWRETLSIPFGNHRMHTVPPPSTAGTTLLEMWTMLTADDRYDDAEPDERAHLLAEASMRTFADRESWASRLTSAAVAEAIVSQDHVGQIMASYRADRHVAANQLSPPPSGHPENPAGTSFVVVDGFGAAVACTVTLNNLFGIGRIAPGTGVILGAVLPDVGSATSPAPVLVVNHNTGKFFFAGSASGGAAAPTALSSVMTRALIDGIPLSEAIAAPRIHHGGVPDAAVHEPAESTSILDSLRRRGHAIAEVPEIGRVNAAYCSEGLPDNPDSCLFGNDGRGHGLATAVQF